MTAASPADVRRRASEWPGAVVRPVAIEPAAAAARLRHLDGFAWLDSSAPGGPMGRYSYITARPFAWLKAAGGCWSAAPPGSVEAVSERNPWDELATWLSAHETVRPAPGLPPFQGGLVGYLGYDLGRQVEELPAIAEPLPGVPDLVLGAYRWVLAFDHAAEAAWLVGHHGAEDRAALEAEFDFIEGLLEGPATPPGSFRLVSPLTTDPPRERYLAAVRRALGHIEAGDIYQVNLSHRLETRWQGDPFALYGQLRRAAPAPYAAYLDLGETKLLSASPERFLRLEGGRVETRPIKGTRPRHPDPHRDRELAAELLASEKDRAENLMIVDLLRNDLGRVCRVGSVAVPGMFALEGFSNVWHLVSTVTGELRPEVGPAGLLRACFPGGSVTGCPKIRAMQVIEELEPVRRGPYCGSVVAIGFHGFMDSSIVIRTVVLQGERVWLQVGGAVVADSDPEGEWQETLAKARSAVEALEVAAGQ